jgi:hypothetical protein
MVGWIPTYAQYCEYYPQTDQEKCASYHVAIVAIRYVGRFLDSSSAALTAIAAGAVGWFTYTLWKAATQQERMARIHERPTWRPGRRGQLSSALRRAAQSRGAALDRPNMGGIAIEPKASATKRMQAIDILLRIAMGSNGHPFEAPEAVAGLDARTALSRAAPFLDEIAKSQASTRIRARAANLVARVRALGPG